MGRKKLFCFVNVYIVTAGDGADAGGPVEHKGDPSWPNKKDTTTAGTTATTKEATTTTGTDDAGETGGDGGGGGGRGRGDRCYQARYFSQQNTCAFTGCKSFKTKPEFYLRPSVCVNSVCFFLLSLET